MIKFAHSPHVRSNASTKRIMIDVCIALIPCIVMGIVYFGLPAALTVLVSCISAVGSEIIYRLIMKEDLKSIINNFDFSSLVTGIIVALILPSNYHLYIPALSSIFAVVVVKMLFGGTGCNLVNPAATGRIFAFISFSAIVDTFVLPNIGQIMSVELVDANSVIVAGATSLQNFLSGGNTLSYLDLFIGTGVAGCIGETCKIAILIGAIYLAIRKVIKIWQPLIAILVAGGVAVLLDLDINSFLPTILSGGLIFGAFFMATDYVTNPTTSLACIIAFVLYGLFTAVLRKLTGYETMSFAILLMNIISPLIDKACKRKPFGYVRQKRGTK